MRYVLFAFLSVFIGLNTYLAITSFQSGRFVSFGTNCACIIWWILQMIDLQFGGWV